jgi:hypothetical protein
LTSILQLGWILRKNLPAQTQIRTGSGFRVLGPVCRPLPQRIFNSACLKVLNKDKMNKQMYNISKKFLYRQLPILISKWNAFLKLKFWSALLSGSCLIAVYWLLVQVRCRCCYRYKRLYRFLVQVRCKMYKIDTGTIQFVPIVPSSAVPEPSIYLPLLVHVHKFVYIFILFSHFIFNFWIQFSHFYYL